jgi:hypothetical protein
VSEFVRVAVNGGTDLSPVGYMSMKAIWGLRVTQTGNPHYWAISVNENEHGYFLNTPTFADETEANEWLRQFTRGFDPSS